MTGSQLLLLGAVGVPWITAVAMFVLGERRDGARTIVALSAGVVTTACSLLVAVQVYGATANASVGLPLLGVRLALSADRMGALFAVVAAGLWLVTTVYSIGYMSHAHDEARFYGFFSVCVGSAIGIALSANLLTLFVFYEALTLATYPLVAHTGTAAALKGGRTYLIYALTGGAVLALGVIWLYALGGGVDFASGGTLSPELVASHGPQLTVVFALLIAGFGVKAALFPAHGWLPAAMVAPAPVSALLHAVAVVKAGVFGIGRVVLDVYGPDTARMLGVLGPLAALAAFTIIFASVRALAQDDLKKRLAYSTIGQLSYIVLGLAIGTPIAAAAAIAHLAHHAVLKITMFFTAGVLADELKVTRVSQMNGVGRRMPLTMSAFTVAALGIIGVPPIAGFVSKWGLGMGGLAGGEIWPLVVLGASSLLSAVYLLPIVGRAWFATPRPEWLDSRRTSAKTRPRFEGDLRMVLPIVLTAFIGLALGPLAGAWWAPATWAAAITGAPISFVVPWSAGSFAMDVPGVLFATLAGVVWLAAAFGSRRSRTGYSARFWVFFVLSAGGSVALAFAQGAAAFYACFSVMALAAYGLVAHDCTPDALRAARGYLAFTLISETLLLMGLVIGSYGSETFAATLLGSPLRDIGVAALLGAFCIKIGTPVISGWMPSTYRAAPVGAVAAIAAVVSSAGVIGLLRFMPGGVVDLATWGAVVIVFGLVAAFYGIVAGVVQLESPLVLAYSSVSQFGLMLIGVGVGLSTAELWPVAVVAVTVYVVHHGFAKAALFAGNDLVEIAHRRRVVLAALALPSLALAGLPLTSGGIAKVALKGVTGHAPASWATILELALPLAAVGTTLLMARFLYLASRRSITPVSIADIRWSRAASFGLLLLFVGGYLWVVDLEPVSYAAHKSLTADYLWVLLWPVAVGTAVSGVVYAMRDRLGRLVGWIPPGDLWAAPLVRAEVLWLRYQESLASTAHQVQQAQTRSDNTAGALFARTALNVEERLLTWPFAAGLIILLALTALLLTSR